MTPEQYCLVRHIAGEHYPALKKKMEVKKDASGFEPFVKALERAFSDGTQTGLGSEAKAWARVNDLEDLIIDLLRYAPDSELAKARIVERDAHPYCDAVLVP